MGTKYAPLLADLFLHCYMVDFIADLIQRKEHRLAGSFNLNFRYIDDVMSLNNLSFGDMIHRIYSIKLEIKATADTEKTVSYLDLHLEIDGKRKLLNKLYEKRLFI